MLGIEQASTGSTAASTFTVMHLRLGTYGLPRGTERDQSALVQIQQCFGIRWSLISSIRIRRGARNGSQPRREESRSLPGQLRGPARQYGPLFAAEGAKVAITAPNEDDERETLAMIEDVGSTRYGAFRPTSLTETALGERSSSAPRPSSTISDGVVLVNNAVTSLLQPFDVWTLEELERNQQVNVSVPWILMTQVLPRMRERGQGWILNLTSSAAELPPGPPYGVIARSGFAGYGATIRPRSTASQPQPRPRLSTSRSRSGHALSAAHDRHAIGAREPRHGELPRH